MVPGPGISVLHGVDIETVEGPIEYSRVIVGPHLGLGDPRELQIQFLRGIEDKRFLQLQRACGAWQGSSVNDNQLLDAFHVWCAEHAAATHFLTTDFKLTRVVKTYKQAPPQLKIVTPSELILDLSSPQLSPQLKNAGTG